MLASNPAFGTIPISPKWESKLERLLREFRWGRVDETFVVEGDLKEQACRSMSLIVSCLF